MTKIYCISDLHLEKYEFYQELIDKITFPEADILILAGDIGYPIGNDKNNYVNFLKYVKSKYQYVILICGNHEYYQCEFPEKKSRDKIFLEIKKICEDNNIILLEKNSVIVNNIKIIGTTLWSCIDKQACSFMNDFRYCFSDRFDYICEFSESYKYLKKELEEDDKKYPIVVVTHHLPTNYLIHERFSNNEINTGFATEILDNLNIHNVKYWFCGHTHEYKKRKYGNNTTLIVNPMGYKNEKKYTSLSLEVFKL